MRDVEFVRSRAHFSVNWKSQIEFAYTEGGRRGFLCLGDAAEAVALGFFYGVGKAVTQPGRNRVVLIRNNRGKHDRAIGTDRQMKSTRILEPS